MTANSADHGLASVHSANSDRIARHVVGPQGHPLWGSLHEFQAGILTFFERSREMFGTAVPFRLGLRRMVLISEPELIEQILVHQNRDFRKHWGVRLLCPVLGRGLLLSEGQFWLKQRRLMQPAFSHQLTELFAGIVTRRAGELAERWRKHPQRDLYRDMTRLTVQIAAEALLGVDIPNDLNTVSDALEVIHGDFEQRFKSVYNLPSWIPTARNRRRRQAVAVLDAVIFRIIRQRKESEGAHRGALSLLLHVRDEEGRGMGERQLRDEVMTLLLAGHDTTANTLTWTWYLLAQHSQIAERLADELMAVIGTRMPTAGDLPALRYCLNVIRESMRLYPPVYVFGREAIRNCEIGGIQIRKGTSALLCQWLVHRDARYYESPLEFQPDRWENDLEHRLPHYAYFPFGGGPRVCIGKDLAMLEAGIVLAVLGSRFDIRLENPKEVHPWPTVTLRPTGAVTARVTPKRAAIRQSKTRFQEDEK